MPHPPRRCSRKHQTPVSSTIHPQHAPVCWTPQRVGYQRGGNCCTPSRLAERASGLLPRLKRRSRRLLRDQPAYVTLRTTGIPRVLLLPCVEPRLPVTAPLMISCCSAPSSTGSSKINQFAMLRCMIVLGVG